MGLSIAIVQRIAPHYRVPFFNKLKAQLDHCGIEMHLYYGQERPGTVPHGVIVDSPWAIKLHNSYLSMRGVELVWQPCLARLRSYDLVILEQANRLMINHALLFRRLWSKQKIAFWGHGRNLQAREQDRWKEQLKRWQLERADWWFAYTGLTRDYLVDAGYPSGQITTVNNTIDASDLKYALDACDAQTVTTMKAALGIEGGSVGLYCGGLYREKRIDFLVDACMAVKDAIPNYHMIIIGEGPESDKVRSAAAACDWIHYVGPVYGNDRAPYLKIADAMLMPGALGLVIIDSFTAETPLITTNISMHGPEIDYLVPGMNGVIAENSVASYSEAVVSTLAEGRLQALRLGCRNSAALYSLEQMVANFTAGVVSCLGR